MNSPQTGGVSFALILLLFFLVALSVASIIWGAVTQAPFPGKV